MLEHVLIYIMAFVVIWVGAGYVLTSVGRMSQQLRMSSFAISYLVLGFFTSLGELSVGINSIIEQDPEIYVGTLIGASIMLFMLVIPLLAITSGRIHINDEMRGGNLALSLVVIAAPVILALDGRINRFDGLICVLLYMLPTLFIHIRQSIMERVAQASTFSRTHILKEVLRIALGVALIFVASRIIVDKTAYFSQLFHISPFIVSLLVVAVGTNVPELSIVLRTIKSHNKQSAFGNYVGSASMNTLLFGSLSIAVGRPVVLTNSYLVSLTFMIMALMLFYIFARSRHEFTRLEGFMLLCLYALFILTEGVVLVQHAQ